eukprot:scaffold10066_cov100-Cylindrotheca_fusiformis.AAC.2
MTSLPPHEADSSDLRTSCFAPYTVSTSGTILDAASKNCQQSTIQGLFQAGILLLELGAERLDTFQAAGLHISIIS